MLKVSDTHTYTRVTVHKHIHTFTRTFTFHSQGEGSGSRASCHDRHTPSVSSPDSASWQMFGGWTTSSAALGVGAAIMTDIFPPPELTPRSAQLVSTLGVCCLFVCCLFVYTRWPVASVDGVCLLFVYTEWVYCPCRLSSTGTGR